MKYTTILADLDNTLFDFNAGEKKSLPLVFKKFGFEFNNEIQQTYIKENTRLWHSYENGETDMNGVLDNRFRLTMKHFGKDIDGHEWDMYYRSLLCECCELMPGAHSFCKALKEAGLRVFVVTNGVEKTQISRLTRSGMLGYFDGVFTSQRIGARKPDHAFFDYVANHIDGFSPTETLVIGDSQATDVKGGHDFGLDTCLVTWGNPSVDRSLATFVAKNLAEAKKICLSE